MTSALFRFEGAIDRKRVPDFLEAMAMLQAYNIVCVPMTGAKVGKGKQLEDDMPGGGRLCDRIAIKLAQLPPHTEINRKMVFTMARDMNFVPNSVLMTQLIKAKAIKKKSRGLFITLPPLLAAPSKTR